MNALARPFYRSALEALRHAHGHLPGNNAQDAAQVIMSLDQMAEMLVKAALLERGKSIMQAPKRSLGLHGGLQALGERPHAAAVEILREHRDNVQHFATYQDSIAVQELFDAVTPFAQELARADLGVADFLGEIGLSEQRPTISAVGGSGVVPVEATDSIQRDAAFDGGVLVWAQSDKDHGGALRVRCRTAEGIRWLTPQDEFEYMPTTNGRYVSAYRQSGGVVLYDLMQSDQRSLLSATGGPGAVRTDLVAAQGLGIPDGLGGGISLIDFAGVTEVVREAGDSPEFSSDWIYWQELVEGELAILRRAIAGGDVETVVPRGHHFSVDGNQLVFTPWQGDDVLRMLDVDISTEHQLIDRAVFPNIRGSLAATLQTRGEEFDVVVIAIPDNLELLRIPSVGFPTGRGPILTNSSVVWEAGRDRKERILLEHLIAT